MRESSVTVQLVCLGRPTAMGGSPSFGNISLTSGSANRMSFGSDKSMVAGAV